MRNLVFLWESWYLCEKSGIFVRNMVFLWKVWYFCEKSGIFMKNLVFLWEILYFCEKSGIFVRNLVFLWKIWYFCGKSSIFVRNLVFLWEIWYFCGKFCIFVKIPHLLPKCSKFHKNTVLFTAWQGFTQDSIHNFILNRRQSGNYLPSGVKVTKPFEERAICPIQKIHIIEITCFSPSLRN